MYPFSTPWKHKKTVKYSDVFKGLRKGALGTNGLIHYIIAFLSKLLSFKPFQKALNICAKGFWTRADFSKEVR